MLLVRAGSRLLTRPWTSPLSLSHHSLRAMSSIYVLPIDPVAPSSEAVPNLDTAKLWASAPSSTKPPKVGTTRIFYDAPSAGDVTALTSLGDKFSTNKDDDKRELVRKAIGSAVKKVKELGEGVEGRTVTVDASADPHAAAVAALLAEYKFTLKTKPPSPFDLALKEPLADKLSFSPTASSPEWETGVVYAKAQNLARTLMELPANLMTPTAFTEEIKSEFSDIPNVEIIVRDEAWAAEQAWLVSSRIDVLYMMFITHYKGAAKDSRPLVFVGKGITFDSGGISLKPSAGMKLMRGDMGGAATVCSAALAIAQLKIPVNLVVLTPLCENLPGPSANKPGDVVYGMNGKSIEVDNTDAEGRLVLSDALYYGSTKFKPHTLIDVATLTGAMDVALGEIYSGIFTVRPHPPVLVPLTHPAHRQNSDSLWHELDVAGRAEFDRFWRMPLDEDYGPQIYSSNADLCNTGGKPAGSCTAALFLKSFVEGVEPSESGEAPAVRWAHLDIAGTMEATRATPYLETGMTGRPTRALIEFASRLSKQ
ncbi:Cytosol aminopeptidase [Grifola frondosa]|uniref:Cytosol aminopeptidase n=1 Tax=Grifola frondosa TaxID=5627 RepID=A0A1C7MRB6_GRIFR|nr:Cytosol aminopeptidase [Grifola frondosa]